MATDSVADSPVCYTANDFWFTVPVWQFLEMNRYLILNLEKKKEKKLDENHIKLRDA